MTLKVLDELNCSTFLVQHSIAVMKKALNLVVRSNTKVDLELVKAGAILHDVGRCQSNEIDHAIIGADILRNRGVSSEVVMIVERHIGAGITPEEAIIMGLPNRSYEPVTIEEKIVSHADNLVHGTEEVNLDFVIKKYKDMMGEDHPSINRLVKLHHEVTGQEARE
ncbi:MAG: TIGR00295 family protein [Methanobacteriaceae archaeon]